MGVGKINDARRLGAMIVNDPLNPSGPVLYRDDGMGIVPTAALPFGQR